MMVFFFAFVYYFKEKNSEMRRKIKQLEKGSRVLNMR